MSSFTVGSLLLSLGSTLISYLAVTRSDRSRSSLPQVFGNVEERKKSLGVGLDAKSIHSSLWLRVILWIFLGFFGILVMGQVLPARLIHAIVMIYYSAYSAGHLSELLEGNIPQRIAQKFTRSAPESFLRSFVFKGRRGSSRMALAWLISLLIGAWWAFSEHWMLNNLLAAATGIVVISSFDYIKGFKMSLFFVIAYVLVSLASYLPIISFVGKQVAILEFPKLTFPHPFGITLNDLPSSTLPPKFLVVHAGEAFFPGLFLAVLNRFDREKEMDSKAGNRSRLNSLFHIGLLSYFLSFLIKWFFVFLAQSTSAILDRSIHLLFFPVPVIAVAYWKGYLESLLSQNRIKE